MIRSLILLLYGGTLLFLALRSLRAQRLKERYVVVLILTGLPFLALAVWPNAISRLAGLMSMPYHTVMILLVNGLSSSPAIRASFNHQYPRAKDCQPSPNGEHPHGATSEDGTRGRPPTQRR